MQVDERPREQFLALNNLAANAQLQPGQRVKILLQ
jgi:predicted Zn-dependent protease